MINKETSDLKKIDPWTTMVPFIAIFILCLFLLSNRKSRLMPYLLFEILLATRLEHII